MIEDQLKISKIDTTNMLYAIAMIYPHLLALSTLFNVLRRHVFILFNITMSFITTQ